MELKELIEKLNDFRKGITDTTFSGLNLYYENDYISVKQITSSNCYVNGKSDSTMKKQWNIICDFQKSHRTIETLKGYKELKKELRSDLKITDYRKKDAKNCYAFRLYNMKKKANREIIQDILDFIFK